MGTLPPRMRKGLICLSLQQKDQLYSGYSASKLVYRDGKQNRVPAIQEKVVSNLQACQPYLSSRKGYGIDYLGYYHMAHSGQPGDQSQPAWVYGRGVLLNQLDLLGPGDLPSG